MRGVGLGTCFQLKAEGFGDGRDDVVDGAERGERNKENAVREKPCLKLSLNSGLVFDSGSARIRQEQNQGAIF